jgi:hypothetical protein
MAGVLTALHYFTSHDELSSAGRRSLTTPSHKQDRANRRHASQSHSQAYAQQHAQNGKHARVGTTAVERDMPLQNLHPDAPRSAVPTAHRVLPRASTDMPGLGDQMFEVLHPHKAQAGVHTKASHREAAHPQPLGQPPRHPHQQAHH